MKSYHHILILPRWKVLNGTLDSCSVIDTMKLLRYTAQKQNADYIRIRAAQNDII